MLGVDQVYYKASRTERHDLAEYYLSLVGLADAMHRRPGGDLPRDAPARDRARVRPIAQDAAAR